jgi:glycosyltransferase involved in cell wall biosynthesis
MALPRVLFVDHAGVLGGAELSLLDVAAALGARAEVVLLADGPFRETLERHGVRVSVEPMGALARVRKASGLPSPVALADAWRVAHRLADRARAADVICANSQKAFVVSALAAWRAHRPLAWMLRDILAPPHFSRSNVRAVVALANWRAYRVIANSRATADAFIAAGGRAALTRVVHNGIDAAPFDAVTDEAARAARRTLGVPEDAYTVVMLGRFHPWKGQQVLLDALTLLPGVHAIIAGAPLFGEDEFAVELTRQTARLGLSDRVHFAGFRDDAPTLLRAADAVVHASVYPEPFGRVIVEGMLARRPVIATNAGGVSELVADGETGMLVPPGDAPALAAAIAASRADPVRAASMAERGAARARAKFTVAAMVRGIEEALTT